MIQITRLSMLVASSLIPVASAAAQSLEGVWRSQGYGYVFEIQGPVLKAFEVSTTVRLAGLTSVSIPFA
jgi:hypothetical protein